MVGTRYDILLIEDSEDEQLFFRNLIAAKKLPYNLTISSSVKEAQEILSKKHEFDLILADYKLDDGTAFDVIDEIGDIPIIFITGWGSKEIAIKAMRAGAADFIEKDVQGTHLESMPLVIERIIEGKRQSDQYNKLHELYETVLANSFDAFALIDLKGNILYANESLIDLSRYSDEEIANLNLADLTIGNARFVNMITKTCCKQDQKLLNLHTTLLPKTGPVVPVTLSASQVKNHQEVLICMRDLRIESELNEEVKLFRKLSVDLIHASFFIWGGKGPEPIISEDLPFAQNADELLMKMGIYYFTALGQGQGHSTGLFGPLPIADVPGYVALAYTFFIDDPSNIDPRADGRSYSLIAFSMPETLSPIFSNRSVIASFFEKRLEEITTREEITLSFLVSLKYELLGLEQEEPVLLRILSENGSMLYSREFLSGDLPSDPSIAGLITTVSRLVQDSSLSMFESLKQIKHKDHVIFLKSFDPFLFFYISKSRSYDEQRKLEEFIKAVQGTNSIREALIDTSQMPRGSIIESINAIADELFLRQNAV
ncbi:MAG: response regulator [Candidatus Hodarchaeales archaeon]|jgi:PAS domain S-box-containing protein